MRRTGVGTVAGFGVAGLVVGFLVQTAVAAAGSALWAPPLPFAITLVAIGVIVIAFAVPIARTVRGASTRPIDPFVAMRVVVLAKACSVGGALLAGGCLGLLGYLFTRRIVPAGPSVLLCAIAAGAALFLLAAGLVAEHLCTLPPEDDDKNDGGGYA